MKPLLIQPEAAIGGSVAEDYVVGLATAGIANMISNVATDLMLLQTADHTLPVTIDNGDIGGSYVTRPHSAYALYAREELNVVDIGRARWSALALLALFDRILRAIRINRVVHIDNWLLSTNLHGDWHGDDLPTIRRLLIEHYPSHLLAIRSIDEWSSPRLLQAARDDGWILVPSRQIWVTDDLERDWRPRRDCRNDRRVVQKSGLQIEEVTDLTTADAERIADLYRELYVEKYSTLNPIFTSAYIRLTHQIGMIRYRVARASDGTIITVAGMFDRANVLTTPIVGYDIAQPLSAGLYRIACYLLTESAWKRGLRLHGSAGAAEFKRLRGAQGVIEYSAFYLGHLSPARRIVMQALAATLERFLVPIMKARGL